MVRALFYTVPITNPQPHIKTANQGQGKRDVSYENGGSLSIIQEEMARQTRNGACHRLVHF
jgi:hypothetical protein